MTKTRGFTLIELMITIAILAIILAIAVPSYQAQMEKGRRSDAVTGLMSTAQRLERCFTRNSDYTHADCPSGTNDSPEGYYSIEISATATTYDLTATGQGAQKDDDCSPFTLDHLGNKTPKGTSDRCWGN